MRTFLWQSWNDDTAPSVDASFRHKPFDTDPDLALAPPQAPHATLPLIDTPFAALPVIAPLDTTSVASDGARAALARGGLHNAFAVVPATLVPGDNTAAAGAAPPPTPAGSHLTPQDVITGTAAQDNLTGTANADTISGGDGSDTIHGGDGNDVIYGFGAADTAADAGTIYGHRVASGLAEPVFAASPPGDPDRLYVIEAHTGKIKIVDLATDQVAATPFLDIPDNQFSIGTEQGLLGLAFSPDYATSGKFYVDLTNAAGNIEVWEYTRSAGDPNLADPASKRLIITEAHPNFGNHNGGWLGFGPDGDLYITLGDGGSAGDPNGNAQNLASPLGKILRIDVRADAFPADDTRNYTIPSDNPFVHTAGALGEIWDYGLRNPFRISFDSATGDMLIADVGQDAREEVDFAAAGQGGLNFGWHNREGFIAYQGGADSPSFTPPVLDYIHSSTDSFGGFAVIGGYVYHGPGGAQGDYFFADEVTGHLWTTHIVNGQAQDFINRDAYLHLDAGTLANPTAFATDGEGRMYEMTIGGSLFRLTPTASAGDGNDHIFGEGGNDTIYGGAGDDSLSGGDGDDTIQGGMGQDGIDGNAGTDTAVYSGPLAAYNITFSAGIFTVHDTRGPGSDGTDLVTNVEQFQFQDGMLVYNAAGQLTSQTIHNNDGTTTQTVFDVAAVAPWASQASTTDAQGSLASQDIVTDSGVRWTNQFDTANAFNWQWQTATHDAQGRLTTSVVALDNGQLTLSVFDAANVYPWASFTITYDAHGNETAFQGTFDNSSPTLTRAAVADAFDTLLWFTRPYDANLGGPPVALTITGGAATDDLFGYGGADTLDGAGGNDVLSGGAGADVLHGGSGSDTFAYGAVTDSTGATFDRITDFDAASDHIHVPVSVSGIDPTVSGAALSAAAFETDLAAAIGAGQLAAHHAVLFAPGGTDFAGRSFLIVDANGQAGYQSGEDYVIDLTGGALGGLSAANFV